MSEVCNKWVLGAYFTEGPYEEIAVTHVAESCKELNITHKLLLVGYKSKGSWNKNTAMKPKVILEALEMIADGYDLAFVDADATIEQYPALFDTIPKEYDIAFHTLNWNDWYGYKTQTPRMEILSGTMFFRNNDKVKTLCKAWYNLAKKTNVWEQQVLQNIIDNYDLKCYHLPIEYCYMKTRPRGLEPLVKTDPVILHHQASRKYKGTVR